MKIKVIIFFLLLVAGIVLDLAVSKPINPSEQPTLAIFSDEPNSGGHCSFEVKKP